MNNTKPMFRNGLSVVHLSVGVEATYAKFLERVFRRVLFSKLGSLPHGLIEIRDPFEGTRIFGRPDAPAHLRCSVQILRQRAYPRIALGGSVGAGESYFEGDWECSDLTALIRIFVLNRELLVELDSGWGAFLAPFRKLYHFLRRNSLKGSRSNISAHYDLGNDFFSLFLDSTLMYSSAIFPSPESTLEEASLAKLDHICRKLDLRPGDHLLEIGTGWGGLALHAASRFGCRVTTTTISKKQHEMALKRIRDAGLSERVTVLLEDYRTLTGQYDKLISVEMIEAVGLKNLPTYFEKCSSLLKPEGLMVLQAITIRDHYYEYARRNVDFIQRYVFPGAGIPSIGSMARAVAEHTDLCFQSVEDIGLHYARTLRRWSENLARNRTRVAEKGYSEQLYRLWQFYFAYCEGGFHEQSISCVQIQLTKPAYRVKENDPC